jgi:hypothetical protein
MAKVQNVVEKKRFVIAKKQYGQGLIIKFTNKKGETYEYNHDAVYDANRAKLEAMDCFNKYGNYTNSNKLPGWAVLEK